VVLAEALAAEQQHAVLVPGVLDLAQRFRIQRAAKIDAADFRPDHGMHLGNRNRPDPLSRDCHVSLPSPPIAPCNISGWPRLVPICSAANCSLFDHLVGAARSAGGTVRPGAPGSIRLYACKLEPPGPFIDFLCNHVSKLGG